MKDYYQILHLAPEADAAEIKRAYRRLATQWHPDKNPAPDAGRRFQEINEAYQVLGNGPQRQRYDMQRLSPTPPPDYTPYAPPRPRRPPAAYRATRRVYFDLRPYLVFTQGVCRAGLAFCLLLAVDYALPWSVSEEPVLEAYVVPRTQRLEVVTSQRKLKMAIPPGLPPALRRHTPLSVYKTPILASVMQAGLLGAVMPTDTHIYGPLVFFPGLLLLLSLLGVFYRGSPEMTVNFGIATTLLLLITLVLVFVVLRL